MHLTQTLVNVNKGKIEVSSALGRGTTFDVYLSIFDSVKPDSHNSDSTTESPIPSES